MAASDQIAAASGNLAAWNGTDPGVNVAVGNNNTGRFAVRIVNTFDVSATLDPTTKQNGQLIVAGTAAQSISGATFNAVVSSFFLVDTTANIVEIFMPPDPYRGMEMEFADAMGTWATHDIAFNGNGGNIENPNSLGTFGVTATYSATGGWLRYRWDAGNTRWKLCGKQ